MNPESEHARANAAAEEILRLIYGEDFEGCAVSLESVAAVVMEAMQSKESMDKELLELHEKVAEAVDLLSTPPGQNSPEEPGSLLSLLGQRLDSIHTITQKLNQTAALIKSQAQPEEP
jgi:gamma-glutamylcysteine synthetase